jgi:hypothetical protein
VWWRIWHRGEQLQAPGLPQALKPCVWWRPTPCRGCCNRIHAYGHFHDESGVSTMAASADSVHHPHRRRVVCVNSAICDNLYRAINPVTVVDVSVPGPRSPGRPTGGT